MAYVYASNGYLPLYERNKIKVYVEPFYCEEGVSILISGVEGQAVFKNGRGVGEIFDQGKFDFFDLKRYGKLAW